MQQREVLRDKRKKDKKAFYLIYQAIDKSAFKKIVAATTSKEAWEILQHAYKGVGKMKKIVFKLLEMNLKPYINERVRIYLEFFYESLDRPQSIEKEWRDLEGYMSSRENSMLVRSQV